MPPIRDISIGPNTFRVYCNERNNRTLVHTNKTMEEANRIVSELNYKTNVCELGFPVFFIESERIAWRRFRPITL